MLVDIVSRNGNLLLNFPLPGSGALDAEELKVLEEITEWMAVNSEGIYATRPWKIFGEGPGIRKTAAGEGMKGTRALQRERPQGSDRGGRPFHHQRRDAVRF